MKRILSCLVLTVFVSGALTLSAIAQQHPGFGRAGRTGGGFGLHHLRQCLSSLDLTSDQKAAIEAIVASARTTLQSDAETIRADRQKLQTDLKNGAEKCSIGADVLTEHADAAKLRNDVGSVRDQILGKLTPDQQTRLQTCFRVRGPSADGRPGSGAGQ